MTRTAMVAGAVFVDLPEGFVLSDPDREFRLPNPAYASWERRRRYQSRPGPAPERWVNAFARVRGGPYHGRVWFPRHGAILRRLRELDAPIDVVEHRSFPDLDGTPGPVDLSRPSGLADSTVTLRPYQAAAVDALIERRNGVVVAPCGAGKTAIGCGVVAAVPSPALVLVHTRDLLAQWVERLRSTFPGVEVGQVGGNKRQTSGRVVVATIQTLARWSWADLIDFGQRFGLVILDEAHHAPASTWIRVMAGLPAWFRLGLTATPERADGLTPLLDWTFGPRLLTITPRQMQTTGRTLVPTVYRVAAPSVPLSRDMEPHERAAAIATHVDRNSSIASMAGEAAALGRTTLVIVDRVEHAETLAQQIPGAAALVGKVTPKRRAALLAEVQAGERRVLVSTTVADEGLDLPALDTVILATPTGNLSRVEQRIGRCLRPASDGKTKTPIVVDMLDEWGAYRGYARKRSTLYARHGWTVREGRPLFESPKPETPDPDVAEWRERYEAKIRAGRSGQFELF